METSHQQELKSTMISAKFDATDNWWGTNTPNTSGNDILNYIRTCSYNPWIVLSINTVSPIKSSDSLTITADLTHDNHGSNTSGA